MDIITDGCIIMFFRYRLVDQNLSFDISTLTLIYPLPYVVIEFLHKRLEGSLVHYITMHQLL